MSNIRSRIEKLEAQQPAKEVAEAALQFDITGRGPAISDDDLVRCGSPLALRVLEGRWRIGRCVLPSNLYVPPARAEKVVDRAVLEKRALATLPRRKPSASDGTLTDQVVKPSANQAMTGEQRATTLSESQELELRRRQEIAELTGRPIPTA